MIETGAKKRYIHIVSPSNYLVCPGWLANINIRPQFRTAPSSFYKNNIKHELAPTEYPESSGLAKEALAGEHEDNCPEPDRTR